MWELLARLGARARPLWATLLRAGSRPAANGGRGVIRLCARHPRWSGAALGVAVVAAGWSLLPGSTPGPTPTDAARMTGMDGELIPVLPDIVQPPAGSDDGGSQAAATPVSPVSLPGHADVWSARPLPAPGQPILFQPPPYRPASVASYRSEDPQAVWLTGTIEESEPPPDWRASGPTETSTPAPWPRH